MRLGVRAHDFGKRPPDELAPRIRAQGFDCVQIALAKTLPDFEPDAGRLSPGLAVHVREALQRHGVRIAVLGCYINLADPDATTRSRQLGRFKEHLRFARDFGCSVVATESGSLNADFSWHADNHGEAAFQAVAGSVRELVAEAEKFGVFVGIEGVERYVISSPKRLRRLLDDIASPNLQVVFDPVNLLSAKNHRSQAAIIEESLALFGERIVILHAKDFVVREGRLVSVAAGQGKLDYELLFRLVKRQKPFLEVVLEDVQPATVAESVAFVRKVWDRA